MKKIKNNRLKYSLITFVLLVISIISYTIGVYAAEKPAAGATHSYAEIGIPKCDNQNILVWDSSTSSWGCGTMPVNSDWAAPRSTTANLNVNGKVTVTGITYNKGKSYCIRIPKSPNSNIEGNLVSIYPLPWYTRSGTSTIQFTPPVSANYIVCRYTDNSDAGGKACRISNHHDVCEFYQTGVTETYG